MGSWRAVQQGGEFSARTAAVRVRPVTMRWRRRMATPAVTVRVNTSATPSADQAERPPVCNSWTKIELDQAQIAGQRQRASQNQQDGRHCLS